MLVSEVIERAYNEFLYPSDRGRHDTSWRRLNASDTVTGGYWKGTRCPRSTRLARRHLVGNTTISPHWGAGGETGGCDTLSSPGLVGGLPADDVQRAGLDDRHLARTVRTHAGCGSGCSPTAPCSAGEKRTAEILAALGTSAPTQPSRRGSTAHRVEGSVSEDPSFSVEAPGWLSQSCSGRLLIPTAETEAAHPPAATLPVYLRCAVPPGRGLSQLQLESSRPARDLGGFLPQHREPDAQSVLREVRAAGSG
jgi:hypothetical protein